MTQNKYAFDCVALAAVLADGITKLSLERALVKLTDSMGVTTLRADDTHVSLFNRADGALRAAKEAGRNTVAQASISGSDA